MASDNNELRLPGGDYVLADPINSITFFVRQIVSGMINTCLPVVVLSVERSGTGSGAGYLSCKPLVMKRDPAGNSLPNTPIPRIPYFRLQHGTAAIVCDPKPGDVGLAVFAQADCTNVNGDGGEKAAGSFRSFDMSDGFYLGGFFGETTETFIHLEDEGTITIKTTRKVITEAPEIVMNAATSFTVNAPQIALNGAISGGGSGGANATFSGDVKAKNISLTTHTHTGVQSGNSSTSKPQ